MADAYLNIAERVLQKLRRPMRPHEIIYQAYADDLLPQHLYGSRQDKTLHARLSEDISADPEKSRFYRVMPGIFFLEEFRLDLTVPLPSRDKFLSRPRRKELRRSPVMLVNFDFHSGLRPDGRTVSISRLLDTLRAGHYVFGPIAPTLATRGVSVVHSFVVVHRQAQVLSFRCGRYFPENDPLYGMRSIGVGGAIFPSDDDLLYKSMFGIVGNGINELRYGIGLPNRLAEQARYSNKVRPYIGVVAFEAHPTVIHVVMSYKCPDEFVPSKSALSINDLRWIDAANPANSLSDFDSTSRVLFEQDIVRELIRAGEPV